MYLSHVECIQFCEYRHWYVCCFSACREKCSHREYEFTPCLGSQNRQCKGKAQLGNTTIQTLRAYTIGYTDENRILLGKFLDALRKKGNGATPYIMHVACILYNAFIAFYNTLKTSFPSPRTTSARLFTQAVRNTQ